MSKRGEFETKAVAIHEAGHAVAADRYGPAGWTVTIEEGERRDGGLDFDDPRWPNRNEVEHWIDRCLAGRWAEWQLRKAWLERSDIGSEDARWKTTFASVRDCAENDYRAAMEYAVKAGLATNQDFDGRFESRFWQTRDDRARKFVEDHWDEIERVAARLECSIELRDHEVCSLVRTESAPPS